MKYFAFFIVAFLFLVVGGGLLFSLFESESNPRIRGFTDGLWLATVTTTTLGYGDTFPITPHGKLVAALLSVSGFAFFGVFTAFVARFILERWIREDASHRIVIKTEDPELEQALGKLRRGLSHLSQRELLDLDNEFDKIFEKRLEEKKKRL